MKQVPYIAIPSTPARRLWPLLLLIFLDSFSYFVVIPILLCLFVHNSYGLLPVTASDWQRNMLTETAVLLSPLGALCASPFLGSASDRYGRKPVLLICLLCIGVGFALPIAGIYHKSVLLILLGRFIAGMGSASQPIAQAAITDVCQGKTRALFLSLIALAMTLALILGPLAGGYLSSDQITAPFWLALAIAGSNFCLILAIFKETKPNTAVGANMLSFLEVMGGFKTVIKRYNLFKIMIAFLCLELGWSQYYQAIFLFLTEAYHYTPQQVSLFAAYLGVVMSFGLIIYPLVLRWFSLETLMRLSMVMVFTGLILCLGFKTPLAQWIFSPLVALFTGMAYISLLAIVAQRVPAEQRGWALGYMSTLLFIAWILTALNSPGFISLLT